MKQLFLIIALFFISIGFSQTTTIHNIKPLPSNITQEYIDGSNNRHSIKLTPVDDSVEIYVNNHYVTTEKIEALMNYCNKLIQFTERNKGMIIRTDDSKGKHSTVIGRLNDRLDVVSIRVTTKDNEIYPMVMGLDRLVAIDEALKTLKQ